MPTARCVCGPQVANDYSLGMASRLFSKPRCPCKKCKIHAREAEIALGKQVAINAKAGICGQCINGMQIGKPAMAGPGGLCQGCSSQGQAGGRAAPQAGCHTQQQSNANQRPESNCGGGPPGVRSQGAECNCAGVGVPGATTAKVAGSGPLLFTGPIYGRRSCRDSSLDVSTAHSFHDDQPCNVKNHGGLHGDTTAERHRSVGRDTLGRPIDIQASGVSIIGMCGQDVVCDESCGYGTGCVKGCFKRPMAALPGGASNPLSPDQPGGDLRGPVGINIFGNEQVNCFVTFLMEILGILLFFAICTITFWITLGYYIVQLVIDLKNADRYVQVAVAIILCLLVLAFCVTLVTNRTGSSRSCCRPVQTKKVVVKTTSAVPKKSSSAKALKSVSCKKRGTTCSASSSMTKRAKPAACALKTKTKSKTSIKPKFMNIAQLRNACKRILPRAKKLNLTPCKANGKMRYSDCQGRAIFQNSRRYAIPTEMKQPPAIVVWLRDLMCRLFRH